jgi:hypothetical protein
MKTLLRKYYNWKLGRDNVNAMLKSAENTLRTTRLSRTAISVNETGQTTREDHKKIYHRANDASMHPLLRRYGV